MPSQDQIPFTPSPDQIDRVLHDLLDPMVTMGQVAERNSTSIPALSLWMLKPDIAERIDALESAFARRARLIAHTGLRHAVNVAIRLMQEYDDEESHALYPPNSLRGREQQLRNRESARKAAHLLLRLTKFQSGVPRTDRVARAARPPVANTPSSRISPSLEDLRAALAPLFTTSDAEPESLDTPASQPVGLTESSRGQARANGPSAAPGEQPHDPRSLKGSNATPDDTQHTPPTQQIRSAPVGATPPHPQPKANTKTTIRPVPVTLTISAPPRAHQNGTHQNGNGHHTRDPP